MYTEIVPDHLPDSYYNKYELETNAKATYKNKIFECLTQYQNYS